MKVLLCSWAAGRASGLWNMLHECQRFSFTTPRHASAVYAV